MRFKRYKSELDYSYALGMAPVIELINARADLVAGVYASPDYRADSKFNIFDVCAERGLRCETNQKIFNVAAEKENIYVLAVFRKPGQTLAPGLPHAVFVNPGDAGNLGTNMRTCLGFGINDVAVVTPGADAFAPKTVRASMGALFHIRTQRFASYDEYASAYPNHVKYLFMLNGETCLDGAALEWKTLRAPVSLVFGNEATGLPDDYIRLGRSVRIPHSGAIDSLNLSVAVGIAAHAYHAGRRRANQFQ